MSTRQILTGCAAAGMVAFALFTATNTTKSEAPNPPDKIRWMSFNEGFAHAQKTKKKILIDVYTDWCVWCKRMDQDVYPDAGIVKLMSEKYVAVKLNAERDSLITFQGQILTERQFAQSVRISSYPTTLFLESDGRPISIVPGYLLPDKFSRVLIYFADDHYKRTSFQEFLKQPSPKP